MTDQTNPNPSQRPRLSRRGIAGAAALAVVVAGTVLVVNRPGKDAAGAGSHADAATAGAQAAVRQFLNARTPEERSAFVLQGERILPEIQSYYAGRDPEPIDASAFQPLPWRFDGPAGDAILLRAERDRGLPSVIAVMKKEDGNWRLDWDLWVQSEDGTFAEFRNRPVEGSEITLRTKMSLDTSDANLCRVALTDPFEGNSMTLPVDRADLAALYRGSLTNGPRHATVQLVWLNDTRTGTLQPAIRRHVCWGFDGIDREEAIIPSGTPNIPVIPAPAVIAPPVLAAEKAIHAAVETAALAPARSNAPVPNAEKPISSGHTAMESPSAKSRAATVTQ